MNYLKVFSLVCLGAIVLGTTSCKKQSVLDPEAITETATIKGKVTVLAGMKWEEESKSAVNITEAEPVQGVTVVLEVPYSAYDASNTSNEAQQFTTTTDAEGNYSFSVKYASTNAKAVTVYTQPFESTIYKWDNADKNDKSKVKTVKVRFNSKNGKVSSSNPTIKKNNTIFIDDIELSNPVEL